MIIINSVKRIIKSGFSFLPILFPILITIIFIALYLTRGLTLIETLLFTLVIIGFSILSKLDIIATRSKEEKDLMIKVLRRIGYFMSKKW